MRHIAPTFALDSPMQSKLRKKLLPASSAVILSWSIITKLPTPRIINADS